MLLGKKKNKSTLKSVMAADSNPDKTRRRCHHCAGPLSMEMETSEWTVSPFIRESFSVIGSSVGSATSAVYGCNHDGAIPALAQLASSSCHAAFSSRSLPPPAPSQVTRR